MQISSNSPVFTPLIEFNNNTHITLKDYQYKILGRKITISLYQYIGKVGVLQVNLLLQKIDDSLKNLREMSISASYKFTQNYLIQNNNCDFLNEEEEKLFLNECYHLVVTELKKGFSNLNELFERGLTLNLSTFEPSGVIKKAADSIKKEISYLDVPLFYDIILTITQYSSESIKFKLTHKSENLVFMEEEFTLEELQEEAYKDFLN
ncbi:hypothetical protein BN1013_02263 [Candidatus Rubidus massiliensis]|nr:hypothetical protein BN1013_02263 [Candidatus Rubidus massiliensis]